MKLYTFKKTAWHARYLSWLFGIKDIKSEFRTMCPYFWTLVVVLLFTPIIVPMRLLGKRAVKGLDYLRTCKDRNYQKKVEKFESQANKFLEGIKNKEFEEPLLCKPIYEFVSSNFYRKNSWIIGYDTDTTLDNYAYKYRKILNEQKYQQKIKRENKIEAVKQSKIVNIISIILAIIVSGLAIGVLGFLLFFVVKFFINVDYTPLTDVLPEIGMTVGGILVLIPIFKFIILLLLCKLNNINYDPLLEKLQYIFVIFLPFIYLGKGLVIIVSMIHATYKRYCPIITWKE